MLKDLADKTSGELRVFSWCSGSRRSQTENIQHFPTISRKYPLPLHSTRVAPHWFDSPPSTMERAKKKSTPGGGVKSEIIKMSLGYGVFRGVKIKGGAIFSVFYGTREKMQIHKPRQRTGWGTGMKPKMDATRTCFGKRKGDLSKTTEILVKKK